jgi:hypothetical protein
MMRHAYDKLVDGNWEFDADKARRNFLDAFIDDAGVLRWKSNGHVPPEDCLADFALAGCEFDIELASEVREREAAEFLAEYRRHWKPPTGEHLAELRAEFGEGATVEDVVAGRKVRL